MSKTMKFSFASDVYKLGVRGVYFNIRGMRNLSSDERTVRAFIEHRLEWLDINLENSNTILGFDNLHSAVSKRPDKLTASPLGLLRYFREKGDIPRINGIVDVYNAVSVSTGVAIGAHDLAHVKGDIELRLTNGRESFWPLGSSKPVKVPAGEYAYIDANDDILCRLEVRQVEKTKVTLSSSDIFFIVQGHAQMEQALIESAAKDLERACISMFGGVLVPLYP